MQLIIKNLQQTQPPSLMLQLLTTLLSLTGVSQSNGHLKIYLANVHIKTLRM